MDDGQFEGFYQENNLKSNKISQFYISEVKLDRSKAIPPVILTSCLPDQPKGKYVCSILDSIVICDGTIRFGDEILQVNGVSVENMTMYEVTNLITTANSTTCLDILVRSSFLYIDETTETVTIERSEMPNKDFDIGFSFSVAFANCVENTVKHRKESTSTDPSTSSVKCQRTGSLAHFVISFVSPDCLLSEKLHVGDAVLEINNVNCSDHPEMILSLSPNCNEPVTLKIQRAKKSLRQYCTIHRVSLCKKSRLFGFSLKLNSFIDENETILFPEVEISNIDENGMIARHYSDVLMEGDVVLEVNKQSTYARCVLDVADMVAKAGKFLKMVIKRKVTDEELPHLSSEINVYSLWNVYFADPTCKSKNVFTVKKTFCLNSPQSCNVAGCLSECYQVSGFDNEQMLKLALHPGDIILKINEHFLGDLKEKHISKVISSNCTKMDILLIRENTLERWNIPQCNDIRYATLVKDPTFGFGFGIIGGELDFPITISTIYENSPAWYCSSLKLNDQILSINGHSIAHMKHEEFVLELARHKEIILELTESIPQSESESLECTAETSVTITLPSDMSELSRSLITADDCSISKKLTDKKDQPPKKRSILVRSLTEYNHKVDKRVPGKAFSFSFGDLIMVSNASDKVWWQATKLDLSGEPQKTKLGNLMNGLIPSNENLHLRLSQPLGKNVRFNDDNLVTELGPKKNIFSKKGKKVSADQDVHHTSKEATSELILKRQKSYRRALLWSISEDDNATGMIMDEFDENMANDIIYDSEKGSFVSVRNSELQEVGSRRSFKTNDAAYQIVRKVEVTLPRPVVLLGEYKERLGNGLVMEHPDLFSFGIPHTTRPPRPKERDGVNYHFLEIEPEKLIEDHRKSENSQFVEFGVFQGHVYGTSIQSVLDVAQKGKHCILFMSPTASVRLSLAKLYPIIILVKPPNINWLSQLNPRLTSSECEKTFLDYRKLEYMFKDRITEILLVNDYESLYDEVFNIITRHSSHSFAWEPTEEPI